MSEMSHPFGATRSRAFPSSWAAQCAVGLAILLAMALWLDWIGRPLTCACGEIRLWDGDPHSPGASQQFADWYSALHVIYGVGLFAFIRRMAPQWPTSWVFLMTLASSAIWEVMENTPLLIAMFGNAPGAPYYEGDSVLNAFGDTLFVAIGFAFARWLPIPVTIGSVLALEAAIAIAIGDGFVLGTLRLLGVTF